MGLITPSYNRRYNAAIAIYMAAYTFTLMASDTKARVDDRVYASMNRPFLGFSPIEFQRLWPPQMQAAWRAYAMFDLGIPPAIQNQTWQLPKSRRMWGVPKTGPMKLYSDFRPYDESAVQAKLFLKTKGLDTKILGQWAS